MRINPVPPLLGTLSIISHLASFIVFQENLLLSSIYFFIGQIFLLLFLILCNSKLYLNDIRLIFVGLYSLYGLAFPLLTYFGIDARRIFLLNASQFDIAMSTFLYASGLFGFSVGQMIMNVKFDKYHSRQHSARRPLTFNLIVLICSIFVMIMLIHLSGINPFDFTLSRYAKVSHLTKGWVYLNLLLLGWLAYFICSLRQLKRRAKIIFFIAFALYIIIHFSLGDRRELSYVFLLLFLVYAQQHKIILSIKNLIFIIFLVVAVCSWGIIREHGINPATLIDSEIFHSFQTVVYYVTNPGSWDLKYGETYLRFPLYFVPRFLWPQKPVSLNAEFASSVEHGGGTAFTFTTEAYINFGIIGPFLFFLFLSVLLSYLVKKRNSYHAVYLFACLEMLSVNRGDFGTSLMELLVMLVAFKSLDFLNIVEKDAISAPRIQNRIDLTPKYGPSLN